MGDRELKRVNLRMSEELYDFFKGKADAMGVPYSNLIVTALAEYKAQKEGMDVMSSIVHLFNQQGFSEQLIGKQLDVSGVGKPSVAGR